LFEPCHFLRLLSICSVFDSLNSSGCLRIFIWSKIPQLPLPLQHWHVGPTSTSSFLSSPIVQSIVRQPATPSITSHGSGGGSGLCCLVAVCQGRQTAKRCTRAAGEEEGAEAAGWAEVGW
jgi:hypothetical protein